MPYHITLKDVIHIFSVKFNGTKVDFATDNGRYQNS